MKILALEPYFGGSHQAFLEGWAQDSRHEWEIMRLPAHSWKWRMRHAAMTFAQQVEDRVADGAEWDAIVCSSMLSLAEFRGLLRRPAPPSIVYFHENQLTYPVQTIDARDVHFAITHLTTALAADEIWFNSLFHRDEFLDALNRLLRAMPDHHMPGVIQALRDRSRVEPPGISGCGERVRRREGPLHIVWAARWEHDKRPEIFFDAIERLESSGVSYQLSVMGQRFRDCPAVFDCAQERLSHRIVQWGEQPREKYFTVLGCADVFVSTASHEFFGLAAVEAADAGAAVLLPHALAYPEVFAGLDRSCFHNGAATDVADRLAGMAEELERTGRLQTAVHAGEIAATYRWSARRPALDEAVDRAARERAVSRPGK